MVLEKKIFSKIFFQSMEVNDSPGCGQFGPQGQSCQDLCRGYKTLLLLYTKYIIYGPHDFREEDLF